MNQTPGTDLFPIIDSHVDLLYDIMRKHPDQSFGELPDAWISIPKLNSGRVRIIVSVFYLADVFNGVGKSANRLRDLFEYAEKHLTGLTFIENTAELEACFRGSGTIGAVPLLENADALMEFPPESLWRRGFRMVGLTHAGSNSLGDGNGVRNPEGLTRTGRELARELDRLGFAIDTAHLSEPAFRQLSEIFSGPMISTHTGLRAFFDTPRNLSDEQVEVILSRKGVIGIAVAPEILSPDGRTDISGVFRQIDHLVQRHGAGGVGIGSDFGGYDKVCAGLEDPSRLPSLAEMMKRHGYPEEAIAGIMGGNWYRFLSRMFNGQQAG